VQRVESREHGVAPAVSGLGGLGIDRGLAQPFVARLFCKRSARIWTTPKTGGCSEQRLGFGYLWCERCQHHAPLACAVAVIRWGPDAPSDKLRAGARCTSCGSKGATLQHPGWAGNHIGFYPFPTNVDGEVDATTRSTRHVDNLTSAREMHSPENL
jgi:hypothetical protein